MTTWNPHLVITAIACSGDNKQFGLAIRIVASARPGRSVTSCSCRIETARPVQIPLPPILAAMVRRYRPAGCARCPVRPLQRGPRDQGRRLGDHWPWAGRPAIADGRGMREATPAAGWEPWTGIVPEATSFGRCLTVTEAIWPTGTVHTVDRSRAGLGLAR